MNRSKLDALLAAGIITLEQHQAAIASIVDGIVTELPQLQLTAPGTVRLEEAPAEPDAEPESWDGVLTGTITQYGVLIPSHGMILEPGCLQPRQPLTAVKMMRDHNHSEPVGYMLDVDASVTEASFQIAPTERDRVLQEVNDKLRDGLSVGFTALEYDIDDDWIFHVIAADLYEVSLCAVPAVVGAGVTSVAAALATLRKENRTMNRAQLAAALAAGTITQEAYDSAIATLDALAVTPPVNVPAELAAGPELQVEQPAPPVQVQGRALSLAQVNERLTQAANSGNFGTFQLAIADVLASDDVGAAFLRDDWQGEAWRENEVARPWIDAFGAPAELTSLNGEGWEWGDEPEVDEYAGDKTEVPSNEISTLAKAYQGFRIASGHDVDRVFTDFANAEFWPAFWSARLRDYKRKSNAGIRTRVLAKATAKTGTVTTGGVKAVLKQAIKDVRPFGKANRVFLGVDLMAELEDLPTDTLPLWLKSAEIGVDIAEGSADTKTLRILEDATLAAKQIVAFDNRAGKVREKAPFQVEAIQVAHGGIDTGLYSYLRFDDYDPRAIIKRTYVPA
ncbi:HK97 family phage prohead protease [Microbacteriaceae bacterium SG_E_30_P1]|uniref:HK97 family phage prohead protease n=1 Tax=Antiquaquibacter oligotrophicus TaxID=2880260 RepID=A0ABT6KRJ3_9MICO|nr:HK97 family phage prohead protease [Antiquaquibacter oligotrophicus]MDH6181817.1 HK97 family phage prohead protease [Antiquaquibacter oligotrophicus]UDF12504.1 HK97 family phage prohead protease [Antiquaquibacter oligotrophicus]